MILITIINKDMHYLVPIIFEFKDKISKHIIFFDNNDKKGATDLERWIEAFNTNIELFEIDEDSKDDMLSIQHFLQKHDSKELYLNATNADTALLVVVSGYILNFNGKVIAYDKFENTYNLITKKGFTNHKIKNNMKIIDYLHSLNYELITEEDKKEIISQKESLYFLFQNFQDMFKIRKLLTKNKVADIKNQYSAHYKHIKKLNLLKNSICFGILFERFLFLKLMNYNFDDIKIGAIVKFDNYQNEFDILAIKNNHIYTIECKIGGNLNIKPADIIYKSDSLLEHFGSDSKGIIVNMQNNYEPLNFKEAAYERASHNNIKIYNEFNFKTSIFNSLIKEFFKVKERVFLLGGSDLEMLTIKKILLENGQVVKDEKLLWGAKLSDYSYKIDNKKEFVGIELENNIIPPKFYISIDHHNELQEKASSLEQIAEMLNITLNREEKLVSLNDSGHIQAMVKFGASQEEIDTIRKQDRKAQGVTSDDEKLAKKSIKKQTIDGDIVLIESLTEKFSPIIDSLYEKNVLIYTDTMLNYYGRDIELLVAEFQDLIDENIAYYGGGFGFFGVSDGVYNKKHIVELKTKILSLLKTKKK